MVISFFSVSKILDFLLARYEIQVWSCFFGMIIGSIYYINKDFEGNWSKSSKTALIIGSLGVVWPWKHKVFLKIDNHFVLDRNGNQIVSTYKRYFPDFSADTLWAVFYIGIGILIVLSLEWYGNRTNKK